MSPTDDRHDLPPEQDAVRRLLAEARHDEPVPPTVAARLDAVLEELVAERRSDTPRDEARAATGSPVVDLAARRRRRFTTGLMAAAAVVVAGVGLGQVVDLGGSDLGTASDESAAGGSDRMFGAQESDDGGGSDSAAQPEAAEEAPSADLKRNADGFEVSNESLRRDLRAALRALASTTTEEGADTSACTPVGSAQDPGTLIPVQLDDRPALALYRPEEDGRQRVDVYPCGSPEPERTVTLRVR